MNAQPAPLPAPGEAHRALRQRNLPPSTRRVLQALMDAENYKLPFHEFRRAFHVKGRSYGALLHRLLDQSLIVPYGDLSGNKGYALTWYGKRALDADADAGILELRARRQALRMAEAAIANAKGDAA